MPILRRKPYRRSAAGIPPVKAGLLALVLLALFLAPRPDPGDGRDLDLADVEGGGEVSPCNPTFRLHITTDPDPPAEARRPAQTGFTARLSS
jgi:hypothetical protein